MYNSSEESMYGSGNNSNSNSSGESVQDQQIANNARSIQGFICWIVCFESAGEAYCSFSQGSLVIGILNS